MRAGRHLLDVAPPRASTDYRRLWASTSLTGIGAQLTTVAVLFQVWEMTHDPLMVGVIGLVRAVPLVVLGLLGGSLADALDRSAPSA